MLPVQPYVRLPLRLFANAEQLLRRGHLSSHTFLRSLVRKKGLMDQFDACILGGMPQKDKQDYKEMVQSFVRQLAWIGWKSLPSLDSGIDKFAQHKEKDDLHARLHSM